MSSRRELMDHYIELEFVLGMMAKAATETREALYRGDDTKDSVLSLNYWTKRYDRLTS